MPKEGDVEKRLRGLGNRCAGEEILRRLAKDPADGESLIALYEGYKRDLEEASFRYFGKSEISKKAVNTVLAFLCRAATGYDPQTMDAGLWVRHFADAEARRLREALDKAGIKDLGDRRPM